MIFREMEKTPLSAGISKCRVTPPYFEHIAEEPIEAAIRYEKSHPIQEAVYIYIYVCIYIDNVSSIISKFPIVLCTLWFATTQNKKSA